MNNKYQLKILATLAEELGFSLDVPWRDLPEDIQQIILYGHDYEVKVSYRNRWGRERRFTTGFEGAVNYVERKRAETESQWSMDKLDGDTRQVPCPSCHGARLRPEVLAVRVGDLSIAALSDLSIAEARDFLNDLERQRTCRLIAAPVLAEIRARLNFLVDVGLTYLTLSRAAGTLAGGEAQRIRLATQIGSGLVGVLYVLDEPSIGLHQRDNRRLIKPLSASAIWETLSLLWNMTRKRWGVPTGLSTLVQGQVSTEVRLFIPGPLDALLASSGSLTGDYLAGRRMIHTPSKRRAVDHSRALTVEGVREHNLNNVSVSFPLSCFTAVTGVSGSGKSTLVNSILYRSLASRLNGARLVPGLPHRTVTGMEHLDKVVHVDQSPIGRTPRSNPATYTGVWDHIRKLFAETQEAKVRGYGPGRFSFNVKGGRCESCKG